MPKLLIFLMLNITFGMGCDLSKPVYTPMPTPAPESAPTATSTYTPAFTPMLPTPTLTPNPTSAPTVTFSPEEHITQALQYIHGEYVWGVILKYSPDPTEIVLLACVGEELDAESVEKVAEDFVQMVEQADTNENRWYHIQLHRCDRNLHGSPYQIRKADCIDTIAYGGWAGNTRGAHSDGSLKQSRKEGGIDMQSRFKGGSIGHCLPF